MNSYKVITTSLMLAVFLFTTSALSNTDRPQPNANFELTVIHGIPGLPEPVDVYANGEYLFSFDFEEHVGPVSLQEGMYNFEVKLLDSPVLAAEVMLEADKSYSVIAHLTYIDGETSGIKLSLFENEISTSGYSMSRVTLRHTADAPAVDVRLNRGPLGDLSFVKPINLSNDDAMYPMEFGAVDMSAGWLRALILPTGTRDIVFDSGTLVLNQRTSYIIYPIGSIFDGTFTLFVQTIELDNVVSGHDPLMTR